MSPHDQFYMRRAIDLAMRGRGRVEPNPMVGCVIVKDGRLLGEGWHAEYGGPHAEPYALGACTESTAGATAYVTLEPCCHTNKQTPPCVPRLIAAGLGRVVVGAVDPNPQVGGRGIAQLRAAGVEVTAGVLEAECRQLAAPFFASTVHRRPYVTLKWAQTSDRKIAGPGGARLQISNAESSRAVHEFRARCDAIMVGIKTALADDPALTARGPATSRPLLRVVMDGDLRLPLTSRLVATARSGPVLIYCNDVGGYEEGRLRRDDLRARGVEITSLPMGGSQIMLAAALQDLYRRWVTHLLVEPGPTLARSFFASGLVDRLWVFRSPKPVDDDSAPAAAAIPTDFVITDEIDLDGDRLTEYLNPASPVYFKAEPSADLKMITPCAQDPSTDSKSVPLKPDAEAVGDAPGSSNG